MSDNFRANLEACWLNAERASSERERRAWLEMAAAWNSGHIRAFEPRSAENTTPTSYETFVAEEFLPRFQGKSAA